MEGYVYRRTKDGVHYLDLAKTWEKLMIAARIIASVQRSNPKDVLVSSLNKFQRAKFYQLMAETNILIRSCQAALTPKEPF